MRNMKRLPWPLTSCDASIMHVWMHLVVLDMVTKWQERMESIAHDGDSPFFCSPRSAYRPFLFLYFSPP